MKKKIVIGLTIFWAIIILYTIRVEATFEITNFSINCIVEENGDMEIEENIQYYTDENKNGLIRTIDTRNDKNTKNSADNYMELDSVLADGVKYRQTSSANVGENGVYTLNKSGSEYEIKVFSPFKKQTKNITYKYKLKNVAVKYQDTAELYWNFIGPEWDCDINNVKINIILPEKAENGKIYVYGHGADNGTFTKTRNYIMLNASDLDAYQALDARILFSASAIPDSTKIVNKRVLDKYINEEEGLTAQTEKSKILIGYTVDEIAVGLSVIILLIGIYLYFKYDKEFKVEKYHYYREIPYNLEPEILQNIYYGTKSKNSFWVTFLNLVKKGVFRIEKTTNEVGKETDKIVFQKNVPGLKEYQKDVAEIIINCMSENTNEIDILKLQSKLKLSSHKEYENFEENLESEKQSLFGEVQKVPKKVITILGVLMAALIVLIVLLAVINPEIQEKESAIGLAMSLVITTIAYTFVFASTGNGFGTMLFLLFHCGAFQAVNIIMLNTAKISIMYIPYVLLFILIQYVVRIKKYCKEERQILEKLKGLRRFLKDYSLLEEKEDVVDVVVWEEYLILAIALGLNNKIINEWYEYGKMFTNSNIEISFNNMGGYTHVHTTMKHGFVSYTRAMTTTSSYSGSSGGFSSGSSSGGGGRRRWWRKLFLRI